jgi:ferrous iron transport protein B
MRMTGITTTAITIALAGNPNVGKSTIFNALTGSDQHVGNWPGKTVEKRSGVFTHASQSITLIDLPGTYSLSAYSAEEQIARDFIVKERPHLVVNVVDASNIERNLYLTAQIIETGIPLLVVLNMQDQAAMRGIEIDAASLSALLGDIPVIAMSARRGEEIVKLKQAMLSCVVDREPTI